MDKGGQSLLSFPVWHGKGQEVNKLKSYAVNQLKVTRNTFRDPIIAAVTVSMIAVLLIFVVWPLLEVVKQSLVDTAGNYSFQAYKIFLRCGKHTRLFATPLCWPLLWVFWRR